MGKKAKTEFLNVVEKQNSEQFIEFGTQHKSKKSQFSFGPLVKSMSKEELLTSWENVFKLLLLHAPTALEIEDLSESEKTYTPDFSCAVFQTAVNFGIAVVDQCSTIPLGLLQSVCFWNEMLFQLPISRDNLSNNIIALGVKFWCKNLDGKEQIISNIFISLVMKSTEPKGTKSDIKRVYEMRDAVKVLYNQAEFDQEVLLYTMKACCTNQRYLSTAEGLKFIEYLLCIDEHYIEEMHESIKLFIPSLDKKHMTAYGTIYCNAWMYTVKNNLAVLQEKLETHCIQDFMYHAIHGCRKPGDIAPMLRKLLAPIHMKKKDLHVSKMLRDLYQPILWRALKNSNGDIRANAAQLFFDVFPLEDPEFNIVETETELQTQLVLIQDLLHDEYPVVRSLSIIGVCLVMSYQWELLSNDIVKTYFNILVEDLAFDSSSIDVRVSVAKGLRKLLEENQLAIPSLKIALTKIVDLFHDISEKVRIEFCHLLLAVKKIRFIKYFELVPIEHLLARLDEDSLSVAILIVELIHNSFLPPVDSKEMWISRCVDLIKTDHSASRVFFKHLKKFVTVADIVDLMVLMCRTVNLYIQTKTSNLKSVKKRGNDNDKENLDSNLSDLSKSFAEDGPIAFDNPVVLEGVFDALSVLWLHIQNDLYLPEHRHLYKELMARFSAYVPIFLEYFKNHTVWKSLCFFSGVIPPALVPSLSDFCMSRLQKLAEDAEPEEYETLLSALICHGKAEETLLIIRKWMLSILNTDNQKSSNARKRRKGKRNRKIVTPKPYIAVKLFDALLQMSLCRKTLLQNHETLLKEFAADIKYVEDTIRNEKTSLIDKKKSQFLQDSMLAYETLHILLHKTVDPKEYLKRMFNFVNEVFFKSSLEDSSDKLSPRQKRRKVSPTKVWINMGIETCKDTLKVATDATVLGMIQNDVLPSIEFIKNCLESEHSSNIVLQAVTLMHKLAEANLKLPEEAKEQCQKNILDSFRFVMQKLVDDSFVDTIPPGARCEVAMVLRRFVLMKNKTRPKRDKIKENALVNEITDLLISGMQKSFVGEMTSDYQCPTSSLVILSVFSGNTELMKSFLNYLRSWMKDKSLTEIVIVSILMTKALKNSKNILKKINEPVKDLFHVLKNEGHKANPESNQSTKELLDMLKENIEILKMYCTSENC